MSTPAWSEILADDHRAPLWARLLRALAAFLVIAVGVVLILVLLDFKGDMNRLGDNNDSNKDELIDEGEVRLDKSLTEHTRTQTMVCFAHPHERDINPTFDGMCAEVISRWMVNTEAGGFESP